MALLVILGVIALFVIILIVKGIVIIPQAETMVIERLGRFNRVLDSGVNVIIPIIERPQTIDWKYIDEDRKGNKIVLRRKISRIDLRETVYDFPKQNVITKDNVAIEINAMLYFQITDTQKGCL